MHRTKAPRSIATRRAATASAGVVLAALLAAGCEGSGGTANVVAPGTPLLSPGSGTSGSLIGRATFDAFKVKRTATSPGGWEIEIAAEPQLVVATQTITFAPGAYSGWHTHRGPVLISVVEGTVTFYEADDPTCTGIVRTQGTGYVDTGIHAHIARNESATTPAKTVVTYLLPPPGTVLRDEADPPGNCPF